jgi:hypothetical protein
MRVVLAVTITGPEVADAEAAPANRVTPIAEIAIRARADGSSWLWMVPMMHG